VRASPACAPTAHGAFLRTLPLTRILAAALGAASFTVAVDSRAAEPPRAHRLVWNEEWPRFRVVEYGLTAALLLELGFVEFRAKPPDEANWKGGILFDQGFRDVFRASGSGTRETLGDVADFITLSLQFQPVVIDAAVVPLLDRWNFDVAWQMTMMNFEAMGFVGLLTRIGHTAIARERPSIDECRANRRYDKYCGGTGTFASFPSGHSSGAFLGAGLMCAHHLHLPVYGGGAPDVAACLLPVAAATATSTFRLISDRHYMTDIGLGAVLGFFGGYGLPQLFHYGHGSSRPAPSAGPMRRIAAAPLATGDRTGVTVFGIF
jgi:membrane-associated phospholipid phosphatase